MAALKCALVIVEVEPLRTREPVVRWSVRPALLCDHDAVAALRRD